MLTGAQAFQLHDTYGFPIDLTLEMAAEQGVAVDETAFRTLMKEQRDRARADALAKRAGRADNAAYQDLHSTLSSENGKPVQFIGYTDATARSRVVGLLVDGVPGSGGDRAGGRRGRARRHAVLRRESGGQLADTGAIVLDGGARIEVDDVQAPVKGLSVHHGRLVDGTVTFGESGTATHRRRPPTCDRARPHRDAPGAQGAARVHRGERDAGGLAERAEPAAFRLPLAVGHPVGGRRGDRGPRQRAARRTTSRSPTPS